MPHYNHIIPAPTRRGDPPTLPPQSRRAATPRKRESRGGAAGRREPLHFHDLALHGELCKDLRRRESIAPCAGMFAPTRRMRRLHSLVPGAGPVAHLPAYPPCVDVVSNTDTSASSAQGSRTTPGNPPRPLSNPPPTASATTAAGWTRLALRPTGREACPGLAA